MRSDFAKQLDSTRNKIAALQSQLAGLQSAPLPKAEALARVDAAVDRLRDNGDRYRPHPTGAVFAWPEHGAVRFDPNRIGEVLAWMFPDAMRDALQREVAAFYTAHGSDGTAPADLEQQRAKVARELFEHELHEERLITEAEAAGFRFDRRPDADPRAIAEA
jgi:hypothetical protein